MKGWEMVSPVYKSLILLAFNVPTQPSPSLYESEPQSWEVEIVRGKVSQCQGLPAVILHAALGDTVSVSLTLDCQSHDWHSLLLLSPCRS